MVKNILEDRIWKDIKTVIKSHEELSNQKFFALKWMAKESILVFGGINKRFLSEQSIQLKKLISRQITYLTFT